MAKPTEPRCQTCGHHADLHGVGFIGCAGPGRGRRTYCDCMVTRMAIFAWHAASSGRAADTGRRDG